MTTRNRARRGLALAIVATALPTFMASLDNLVMMFAMPVIQADLGASVVQLQWFVNAYAIAFATLMLPMSALGDRFGRRRVFSIGILLFSAASAAAALSTSAEMLIAARTAQGIAAAAIVPLSLALLSVAAPEGKRALAVGIWGGVNGLGIATGPIVGGAVVEGFHWSGIFWINIPIGIAALVLTGLALRESHGRRTPFDAPGVALAALVVFPLIWAVVEGHERGWSNPHVMLGIGVSAAAMVGFLYRSARSDAAFLPLRLFRDRTFTLANASGFLFSAGVFGSIFLLSQFLQVSMRYGALEAGLRAAPWTLAPMIIAPIVGVVVHRYGVRTILIAGLGLQAIALMWMAVIAAPDVAYSAVVIPMLLAGIGMGLTFGPLALAVLQGRPENEHGIASGVNSTLRQLGVAIGIALAAVIFTANGDYLPGQPFVDGIRPALILCSILVAASAALSIGLSSRKAVPISPTPVVPVDTPTGVEAGAESRSPA